MFPGRPRACRWPAAALRRGLPGFLGHVDLVRESLVTHSDVAAVVQNGLLFLGDLSVNPACATPLIAFTDVVLSLVRAAVHPSFDIPLTEQAVRLLLPLCRTSTQQVRLRPWGIRLHCCAITSTAGGMLGTISLSALLPVVARLVLLWRLA